MDPLRRTNVYDLMIAALAVILVYNFYSFGAENILPVIIIVLSAAVLDVAINYAKERKFSAPKSAIITGLILAIIAQGSLPLLVALAVIAILSKHVIRLKGRHIFNPANFALFIGLFFASETWWGTGNALLVGLIGLVIVFKLKRYRMVAPFLVAHAVIMVVIFVDASALAAHMLSGPLLFFAFYMLIEPVTSPQKHMLVFGVLAGVFAAILYVVWLPAMLVGALFFANLSVPVIERVLRPKSGQA